MHDVEALPGQDVRLVAAPRTAHALRRSSQVHDGGPLAVGRTDTEGLWRLPPLDELLPWPLTQALVIDGVDDDKASGLTLELDGAGKAAAVPVSMGAVRAAACRQVHEVAHLPGSLQERARLYLFASRLSCGEGSTAEARLAWWRDNLELAHIEWMKRTRPRFSSSTDALTWGLQSIAGMGLGQRVKLSTANNQRGQLTDRASQ